MEQSNNSTQSGSPPKILSNADIADRLASLAQLLSTQKENPYKVKAYYRAAERIRNLPESLDEMVHREDDLTQFSGIGAAIASAIREIVTTGTLSKLERLRGEVNPVVAELTAHPRLDPKRVMRVYKKLNISSLEELRQHIDNGEVEKLFGIRMAQHIRQGLTETNAMLLYRANNLSELIEEFLLTSCHVPRVEAAGEYRRRVEVIDELVFVIETDNLPAVVERMKRYGGRTPMVEVGAKQASFALSSGILLRLQVAAANQWGFHMVACTGSKSHLRKLAAATVSLREMKRADFCSEKDLYHHFGLQYIEPELREGNDEIEKAKAGTLPRLVTAKDIRGELHAHSLSSDGSDSIEDHCCPVKSRRESVG
jgi:DNA polymerase (family X)